MEEDYCTDAGTAADLLADLTPIMACAESSMSADGESFDTKAYSTCAGDSTFTTDLG